MDILSIGCFVIGVGIFYNVLKVAKKCGIEEGRGQFLELIRKQNEELRQLVNKELASKIRAEADSRIRGVVRSRMLKRGEFSQTWKVNVIPN